MMKKVLFLCVFIFSCDKAEPNGDNIDPNIEIPEGWSLLWNDEFSDDSIDQTKWTYDIGGGGWGNNELQYYTDDEENAYVEDGALHIAARFHPAGIGESNNIRYYSSSRMKTLNRGDWKYVRIDVRAKLAIGQGIWPAIWMLPSEWKYGGWPNSGEIDIMEHVGHSEGTVYGTVHTGLYNHLNGTDVGGSIDIDSVNDKYHTYSIEWSEEKIDFFVDEKNYFTFKNDQKGISRTWPFNENFHLILNIAVGGNWPGSPDNTTIFPQHLVVDYVRVFERDED